MRSAGWCAFAGAAAVLVTLAASAQPVPPAEALPAVPPPAAPAGRSLLVGTGAVLQGLDKITARVRQIEVALNETVAFGTLRITVRACRKAPPEDAPESAVFLEIVEARQGQSATRVFSGWMFASSPALSALEHPVYDVWVTDCTNVSKAPAGNSR